MIPGSGDGLNFYCGKSSDKLFWTHHSLKYKPSVQNPECKTFYVNQSSGPCDNTKIQRNSRQIEFAKNIATSCKFKRATPLVGLGLHLVPSFYIGD